MITAIDLENVRIFQGTGWSFNLPPLTVICGTNSSGKSTILKSLLLLRQSQGLRESSEASHGRLRFFGSEVDLGSFQSFVSRNNHNLDITLSLTIKDKIDKAFLSPDGPRKRRSPRSARESQDYHLKSTFVFGIQKLPPQVSPVPADIEDVYDDDDEGTNSEKQLAHLRMASFEVFQESQLVFSWRVESTWSKPGGEKNVERFEASIPRKILRDWYGPIGAGFSELGDGKDKDFAQFEVRVRGLLPTSMRVKLRSGKLKSPNDSISRLVDWPLPPPIEHTLADLRRALSRIHYLGPLRTPAKRYYIAHLDANPSMDSEGEFLPYVLRGKRGANVLGILLKKPSESHKETLTQALNSWLYYFRSGQRVEDASYVGEIELEATKGVLLELRLQGQGGRERHALADSGSGYSQVLPILVRGLLAEPGDTIVVEQPELHLHPALQVRLAEFFVEMVCLGKQVLIETHSEHLVNAIRVLAAEDSTGRIASNCGIVFVDFNKGTPEIRRLEIQADGTMPEWPSSFFGDSLDLASRLLKAQSRVKHSE